MVSIFTAIETYESKCNLSFPAGTQVKYSIVCITIYT